MWKSVKTSGTDSPSKEVTSKHDEAGSSGKVFGPRVTVGRLFKFQPVCALGPLAYFRWVIDDKLSLDVLPPPGWSEKPKANILLPNAVHSCFSLCTADSFETFALFL